METINTNILGFSLEACTFISSLKKKKFKYIITIIAVLGVHLSDLKKRPCRLS